jgi:2,4-dienoyl-CoA reductase-like NADH-dependent reductase (Old Yellow Enzyme family)
MTAGHDLLFSPVNIAGMALKNRVVMAPMTRSFSPGGVPGADVVAYYQRRARNQVGLILTEGTLINDPVAGNDPAVPRFHGEDALAGWAKVVKAVKAEGGHIMPQLWHLGLMRRPGQGPNPELPGIGPSGLFKPGKLVGEPMTDKQVADAIAAYAQGAADAKRLGFDGIELHGAHGYLIDQFFWEGTNQRQDKYGSSLVARAQFAADIVAACRKQVGPNFPILLRFSQWKQQDYTARLAVTPKELESFLSPLADAGVDIFHCSTRRFWEPEFDGSDLNLAGWTKKLTGKPTITVGSVGLSQEFVATFQGESAGAANIDALLDMLARGDFDLVAVGRALLIDPEWVIKMRDNRLSDLANYSPEALKTLV